MRLYGRQSRAKARGLSLRTGAQTMLYLSHVSIYDYQSIHKDKRSAGTVFFFCDLLSVSCHMQWRYLYVGTEKSEQTVFAQISLSEYKILSPYVAMKRSISRIATQN